ncbi:MAG: O-antigen ligase family protein [Oscillospiraceae bacterium]|nr:O-antigen ligase family protein [Oscillospiraceae bacterium]
MHTAKKLLSGSAVIRFFAAIARFFSAQWSRSAIITRFAYPKARGSSGLLAGAPAAARRGLVRLFAVLRLDKLLRNSIFANPVWLFAAALAAAPLVPTTAAAALAAAVAVCAVLKLGARRDFAAEGSRVTKWVLLYVFVSLAGTALSVDFAASLYPGAMYAFFALLAVITPQVVTTRRGFRTAAAALVFGGVLVSGIGLMQYVLRDSLTFNWFDEVLFAGIRRVYSTLGNPNVLAEYLLLVIPFAGAGIVAARDDLRRLFYAGALAVLVLCLVLTFSRGGYIGLAAAALVFLVMLDRRFIIVAVLGILLLPFVLPDTVVNRFTSIGDLKDGSTSYRLSIWLATLTMLRDYWFVGVGPGTAAFNKIYPKYAYDASIAQHSHNLFLQLVCDAGILALFAFLAVVISAVRACAAGLARAGDRFSRAYRIAAVSAIAGFLVQSMTDYSFYNYRVTLVFWAVVGLTAAAARGSFDMETEEL